MHPVASPASFDGDRVGRPDRSDPSNRVPAPPSRVHMDGIVEDEVAVQWTVVARHCCVAGQDWSSASA